MSQADETTDEKTEPKDETEDKPQAGPKVFDEAYVKELRAENAQWRIKAQQANEKAEEYENQNRSELEKAQAKAAKYEKAKADAEAQLIRFEVATDKAVPKELVSRLRGTTREELEADADELLTLVKSRIDNDKEPDFDGGARDSAPEPKSAEEQHNVDVLRVLGMTPANNS